MKYKWILFDADNTLFDFKSFDGLKNIFHRLGIDFSDEDFLEYRTKNKRLWDLFQDGDISSDELKRERFSKWEGATEYSPSELNKLFLEEMSKISEPLEKTYEVITELSKSASLSIITNGFSAVQWPRVERAGLKSCFDLIVSSEEARIAKPDKKIFEITLSKVGDVDKEQVLMVGDSIESDIRGGANFGIDTCWLNPDKVKNTSEIIPTYEISCLLELLRIASL